jgi:hypothetical protein
MSARVLLAVAGPTYSALPIDFTDERPADGPPGGAGSP